MKKTKRNVPSRHVVYCFVEICSQIPTPSRLQSFPHEGFRTMLAAVEPYSQPKFNHFVGF